MSGKVAPHPAGSGVTHIPDPGSLGCHVAAHPFWHTREDESAVVRCPKGHGLAADVHLEAVDLFVSLALSARLLLLPRPVLSDLPQVPRSQCCSSLTVSSSTVFVFHLQALGSEQRWHQQTR